MKNVPYITIQGTFGGMPVDLTVGIDIDQAVKLIGELYPALIEQAPAIIQNCFDALETNIEKIGDLVISAKPQIQRIKAKVNEAEGKFAEASKTVTEVDIPGPDDDQLCAACTRSGCDR